MPEPNIIRVIEPKGEVSDLIDYIANNIVMKEVGFGYTACQPSLCEIDLNDKNVNSIKFGLDHTYVDADTGQVKGYGIIGKLYISIPEEPNSAEEPNKTELYYITPKEELEEKIQYIHENNIEAQPRPKGKY